MTDPLTGKTVSILVKWQVLRLALAVTENVTILWYVEGLHVHWECTMVRKMSAGGCRLLRMTHWQVSLHSSTAPSPNWRLSTGSCPRLSSRDRLITKHDASAKEHCHFVTFAHWLWPPYVIGGPLYFCPVVSFLLLSSIFFFFFLA